METHLSNCWLIPKRTMERPAFVQLARTGDLCLLIPAWKAIADRLEKPVVFVSREFASIFEGVSYVEPRPLALHWTNQILKAIEIARREFPHCIVTQLHGRDWTAKPDNLPSYSFSMWERTGLLPEYHTLPLVFDRRNPSREKALVASLTGGRPFIIVKFQGITSPFGYVPEVDRVLRSVIPKEVRIVKLDNVVAYRVFDLVGLMDAALGMITVDTMTLHLACASPKPYIAFTRDDGQAKSIPKGNCVLDIGYSQVKNRLADIESTIRSWL